MATSSYQIEGAVAEDGQLPSIWDTFSHTAGKIAGGANGGIACDDYYRWQDDAENGSAWADSMGPDGQVHDPDRAR